MQTRSKLLQAKCRRDKLMESSSSICTIKPSNSDIKQTAPRSPTSFSIISTTTIVKPSGSPEQESVNTTSAPKRMTQLSSGKLFDKDLCIWCISKCFLSPRTKEVMEIYLFMHNFLNR